MTMLSEILTEARWTKGAYARDCEGDLVPVGNTSAVCWCAIGATCRFLPDCKDKFIQCLADTIADGPDVPPNEAQDYVVRYNDASDYETIAQVIRGAETLYRYRHGDFPYVAS